MARDDVRGRIEVEIRIGRPPRRLGRAHEGSRSLAAAAAVIAVMVLTAGCSVAATAPPASFVATSSPTTAGSAMSPAASASVAEAAGVDAAACADHGLSQERCDAIVDWAVENLPIGHAPVASAELLPDPCKGADGRILCARSFGFVARVRLTLADGTTSEFEPYCMQPSGRHAVACGMEPTLQAVDLQTQGYWDTPCSGEGPIGCATPVVPDASAVAASRPLEIASLDLPVGAVGHHEVEVGRAVVPNGILSRATFKLADQTQRGFLIEPGIVRLVLRSTDPTRPAFDNVHLRGRFPGTETVQVLLVYDVAETSPGAVIPVRDLVVR